MRSLLKIAAVAAGYVAAFLMASTAVAVRQAATSGPDAQAASGMYAAGDAMLFVAVFGLVALVPTGGALFFLRPYRLFWTVLSGFAMAVAVTGLVAVVLFAIGRHVPPPSMLTTWGALSVLRILIAPLLALAFLVCSVFSPYRVPRRAFLAATVMETAVSAYGGFVWFVPLLLSR
ncbi:MAG TPA: hypothetical protein VMS22_14730 [Candidatus Eisenbacteria bacterium]|nr:hypothetical protein [Candidatus Eisenbacteria bacterium]